MEREGVSTLSIRSYLRALRCLAHVLKIVCALCLLKNVLKCLSAAIHFMITLVSVLKSVIKHFLKKSFESGVKKFLDSGQQVSKRSRKGAKKEPIREV